MLTHYFPFTTITIPLIDSFCIINYCFNANLLCAVASALYSHDYLARCNTSLWNPFSKSVVKGISQITLTSDMLYHKKSRQLV